MPNSLYERYTQQSSMDDSLHDTTLEPSPRIDDFTKKQYRIPVSRSAEHGSFLASSASWSQSRDEVPERTRTESSGRRRAGPPALSLEKSTPTSPRTSSVRYNTSDFTSPTRANAQAIPISPRRNQPGQVFTTPSNPAKPMMSHSISNESGLSYLTDSSSADDLLSPQRASLGGSASSPVSPVTVDRSKLIGLGELATPRWTAAGSRWAFSPDTEGRNQVFLHPQVSHVC